MQNGDNTAELQPASGFPWPQLEMPLCFVDMSTQEDRAKSISNVDQAQEVCEVTRGFIVDGLENPKTIGVIAPYELDHKHSVWQTGILLP